MKCPIDPDVDLVIADRNGIEVDYCPKCRGVWLDRGELDKIIERSLQLTPPARGAVPPYNEPEPQYDYRYQDKRRKKRGFLGELFDFD
ncbi:MAG: zf-TFIIB domain-containing protein [Fimbriimonadaceae bacterium]|nr:zf-TFIIB domain-containing protein [Fimbriimonadaceae bacterium]QYK58618.1 MAG: zf-TFIIB domain-containing protein [Fimbriimonadaceae bacterium]